MRLIVIISTLIAVFVSGCANKPSSFTASDNSTVTPEEPMPGMNSQGEVVDSAKVEPGSGRLVRGLNNVEGEITGKPATFSKFKNLHIGMSMQEVKNTIGQPTEERTYKVDSIFSSGDSTDHFEMIYEGQGKLVFATGSLYDNIGNGTLIWIIHNANESGNH